MRRRKREGGRGECRNANALSNTRVNCNVRQVTRRGKKVKPSALLEHSSHALLMETSIETEAKTRKKREEIII